MSEPGKAARNEQRKLQATFWNNLSVGAALSGVFLPYLAAYQRAPELVARLHRPEPLSIVEKGSAVTIVLAMLLALVVAAVFRRRANRTARLIED